MKKFLFVMSALLSGAMGDDNSTIKKSKSNDKVILDPTGGNGEVNAQTIMNILNQIYKDGKFYAMPISDSLYALNDRSGGNIRIKTIHWKDLESQKAFVIILEKPMPSQEPLASNIQDTQFKNRNGMTFIHIPIQNIHDKIIITNKEGNKIIEYTIAK